MFYDRFLRALLHTNTAALTFIRSIVDKKLSIVTASFGQFFAHKLQPIQPTLQPFITTGPLSLEWQATTYVASYGIRSIKCFRTGSHTFATCLTSLFINYRNTVYHMDRIKRTSLDTASVTETAIVTGLRTSVRYKGKHITVLCACVFVVHLCLITIALTMDKSNHTSRFLRPKRP